MANFPLSNLLDGTKKLWSVVTGAAADDAAASGNPMLVAGKYSATPATRHDGDVVTQQMTADGAALVQLSGRLVADSIYLQGSDSAGASAVGNGTLSDMEGYNTMDFIIKGVALTALLINFYKKSPSGGIYPCLCSKVDSSGNIILATQTAVLPTVGSSVGATTSTVNISGYTSPTLKIAMGSDVLCSGSPNYHSITLDPTGLTSAGYICMALQAAIRALGGDYADAVIEYSNSKYSVTSGSQGAHTAVRITNGDTNNIAAALKLGVANGGAETDGTGELWHAELPNGWSFMAKLATIIGTGAKCTIIGTPGVM